MYLDIHDKGLRFVVIDAWSSVKWTAEKRSNIKAVIVKSPRAYAIVAMAARATTNAKDLFTCFQQYCLVYSLQHTHFILIL